ncbi:hypothetical protein D623_10011240 [Myotis brandtii]|uniref:Uncharacterized protein n=1 Tax=Myotis brandtii TaxID=109478 RepID=S7MKC6_MYOBR|nr:hypothetical protein D623_10011240 [Myotis brandtii]
MHPNHYVAIKVIVQESLKSLAITQEFLLHDKLLSFCSSDSNNRSLSGSAFQTQIGKITAKGFAASYSKVKLVSSIREFLCYHHHPVSPVAGTVSILFVVHVIVRHKCEGRNKVIPSPSSSSYLFTRDSILVCADR